MEDAITDQDILWRVYKRPGYFMEVYKRPGHFMEDIITDQDIL